MHIDYANKPSKPTLMAAVRKALNSGASIVTLQWGENEIEIERGPWGLTGSGWIGKNGGSDLAHAFKMTT